MTPDYADGDHVICDPHEAVEPGHAVALWRRDRTVWLKWLARIDADAFEVRQMNPLQTFRLRRVDFPYCHAIVGAVRAEEIVACEAAS